MNIELFVSPKGQVVFTCHGDFKKTINQIDLDGETGMVKIIFEGGLEEELNCSVHSEICDKARNQLFCAIGYLKNEKMVASEYVRFSCIMP